MEEVARPHRTRPAHLLNAGADDTACERQSAFNQELHRDRDGVPSARGETLEEGPGRGRLVEVKGLRIELSGEGFDGLGGDGRWIAA